MIEGSGSKTFSKAKQFLYTQPELAHQLLDKITQSTIHYLKAQVEAGADLIQIFDSWAGVLTEQMFYEFSLNYISLILFTKRTKYRTTKPVFRTVCAKTFFTTFNKVFNENRLEDDNDIN